MKAAGLAGLPINIAGLPNIGEEQQHMMWFLPLRTPKEFQTSSPHSAILVSRLKSRPLRLARHFTPHILLHKAAHTFLSKSCIGRRFSWLGDYTPDRLMGNDLGQESIELSWPTSSNIFTYEKQSTPHTEWPTRFPFMLITYCRY